MKQKITLTFRIIALIAIMWIFSYSMSLLDTNSWMLIPTFLTAIIIEIILIIGIAYSLIDKIK